MSANALVFDHVSKVYDLGRGHRALRDVLGSLRSPGGSRTVHALEDVSFEVAEGEAFALIGDNGAGKTTALKIATRIVHPTAGSVRIRGRVGALIEVGSGLHPDLTGRENVDLFGRIVGIPRAAIARSFAPILEFAEIGAAIDQPVKQYSSGIQLRLGVAIAAHLEPDVLIVDEAIAVGDVGFQRKCIERMVALVREGRTLIFVSHDLNAIETLCRRAIRLDHGRIVDDGPSQDVVASYLAAVERRRREQWLRPDPAASTPLSIVGVELLDEAGRTTDVVASGQPVTIRLRYRAASRIERPLFSVGITEGHDEPLFLASMLLDGASPESVDGEGVIDCVVERLPLAAKTYDIWASVRSPVGVGELMQWQRLRRFEIVWVDRPGGPSAASLGGLAPLVLPYRWRLGA